MAFADAGATVETVDGELAATLPCLPGEVECGIFGGNAVRNDDSLNRRT